MSIQRRHRPHVTAWRGLPAAAVPAAPSPSASPRPRIKDEQNAIEQNDEGRAGPHRRPHRPGRRINIPEREMEQELGLYGDRDS